LGLFALGLILISDAILRSEWVSKLETRVARNKRRLYGIMPVFILFGLFGWWIFGRNKAGATVIIPTQSTSTAQTTPPLQQATPAPAEGLKQKSYLFSG
jgi:hypothetical protein